MSSNPPPGGTSNKSLTEEQKARKREHSKERYQKNSDKINSSRKSKRDALSPEEHAAKLEKRRVKYQQNKMTSPPCQPSTSAAACANLLSPSMPHSSSNLSIHSAPCGTRPMTDAERSQRKRQQSQESYLQNRSTILANKKTKLAGETDAQHQVRLEKMRIYYQEHKEEFCDKARMRRDDETSDQYLARLQTMHEYYEMHKHELSEKARMRLNDETEDQYLARLQAMHEYYEKHKQELGEKARMRRDDETNDQYLARLQAMHEYYEKHKHELGEKARMRLKDETEDQYLARLQAMHEYYEKHKQEFCDKARMRRDDETNDQYLARLEQMQLYYETHRDVIISKLQTRRIEESEDEYVARLEQMREYSKHFFEENRDDIADKARMRRDSETVEENLARLDQMRKYAKSYYDEHQVVLLGKKQRRRDEETQDEYTARLHQMREYSKRYFEEHREEILKDFHARREGESQSSYLARLKKMRDYSAQYYKANKDEILATQQILRDAESVQENRNKLTARREARASLDEEDNLLSLAMRVLMDRDLDSDEEDDKQVPIVDGQSPPLEEGPPGEEEGPPGEEEGPPGEEEGPPGEEEGPPGEEEGPPREEEGLLLEEEDEHERDEAEEEREARALRRQQDREQLELLLEAESQLYLNELDELLRANRPDDEVNRHFDNFIDSQRMALRKPTLGAALLTHEGQLRDRVEPHYLGRMDVICRHCGAAHFPQEVKGNNLNQFNDCCNFGRVRLTLPECPEFLRKLYTGELGEEDGGLETTKHFLRNIRAYNNALAMASITYKQAPSPPGRGPIPFKVQGQIYHHMHNLILGGARDANDNLRAAYNQTWLLDPHEQDEVRRANRESLSPVLLSKLRNCLMEANPTFYQRYLTMYELEERRMVAENEEQVRIVITQHRGDRRSCPPTLSEVSAIFSDTNDDQVRGVYCYLRTPNATGQHEKVFIQANKASVDPLTYPLLFPTGFMGWEPNLYLQVNPLTGIPYRNPERPVTACQFYRYMIAVRPNIFNPIHYAGRLFQQYSVDSYIKMETNNLNYLRRCQLTANRDNYQNVADYVAELDRNQVPAGPDVNPNVGGANERVDLPNQQNNPIGAQFGRRVRLPASFKHGHRAHVRNYYDATAVVAQYGQPDPFLTFTCNPNLPEITQNLYPRQHATDRPDIVCRVFTLKVAELLDDLSKKEVLGRFQGHMGVIEFQKRGLPHAHILGILKHGYKFNTPAMVNRAVSAEIPSEDQPILRELVRTHMLHHKCGPTNPGAVCMSEGHCSKFYPKPFASRTDLRGKYPIYRRRDNGNTLVKDGITYTNQDVVPHSLYFLLKFNCHVNIESCTTSSACKYLYKYIYKGPDRARVALVPQNGVEDETTHFQDHRFVCPYSALWNLFCFSMSYLSHTVIHLDVHLPNQQTVTFVPLQHREAVQRGPPETTLTRWFEANAKSARGELTSVDLRRRPSQRVVNIDSRHLHYWEFPKYFRWVNRDWKYSPSCKRLARMWTVSPKNTELFYLRVLLFHICGPMGFSDIRTVQTATGERVECETFEEACRVAGYIDYDREFDACLTDAKLIELPHKMRSIFGTILATASVIKAVGNRLWNKFKADLSEDFTHRNISPINAQYLAYLEIERQCAAQEVNIEDYVDRPPHDDDFDINMMFNNHREDPLALERAIVLGRQLFDSLNPSQRLIAESVYSACNSRRNAGPDEPLRNNCFYLDGPAGSGKTYVYNCLYNQLVGERFTVLTVAWSGIAAGLLPEGMTASTAFKLPVPLGTSPSSGIKLQSDYARYLRDQVDIIIWDEASMIPKSALIAVHNLFCDLAGLDVDSGILFGGKVMLLGGDFRQVLPIVKKGTPSEVIDATIQTWSHWSQFEIFTLQTNMRCSHPEYQQLILDIGNGHRDRTPFVDVSEENRQFSWMVNNRQELVDFVYDDFDNLEGKAILAALNVDVRDINDVVLERYRQFLIDRNRAIGRNQAPLDILSLSADSIEPDGSINVDAFPVDFLNNYNVPGFSPHKLRLIEGAIYMIIRNIDLPRGLSNGQRVRLVGIYPNNRLTPPSLVRVQIISGPYASDEIHYVPKILLRTNKDSQDLPFILQRKQIPLMPGFALTINKSQGQSFNKLSLYLERPVFAHGQLYVAMSRIRDPQNLRILIERINNRDNKIYNVVWHAVLRRSGNDIAQ